MASDPAFDELLTAIEVAAIFKVHPRTVKKWALDGKLPKVHVGRAVRFRASDIAKFADRLEKSSEPAPRNLSPGPKP